MNTVSQMGSGGSVDKGMGLGYLVSTLPVAVVLLIHNSAVAEALCAVNHFTAG